MKMETPWSSSDPESLVPVVVIPRRPRDGFDL